jgi:hypothetical protein
MVPQIKYFSFKNGPMGSSKLSWVLDDIKLPAYDVYQAVTMYYWLDWFAKKKQNPWMNRQTKLFNPNDFWVSHHIRQVIEFTKKSQKYYAIVNYKRERIWNCHELIHHFK